jgi:hypothetical protein
MPGQDVPLTIHDAIYDGQRGPLFFVPPLNPPEFGGEGPDRWVEVPAGKAIMVLIPFIMAWTPEDLDWAIPVAKDHYGLTDEDIARVADAKLLRMLGDWLSLYGGPWNGPTTEVNFAVDGVPVEDAKEYWIETPVFSFYMGEGNPFYEPGVRETAVGAGWGIIIRRLPPGDHEIEISFAFGPGIEIRTIAYVTICDDDDGCSDDEEDEGEDEDDDD